MLHKPEHTSKLKFKYKTVAQVQIRIVYYKQETSSQIIINSELSNILILIKTIRKMIPLSPAVETRRS